jgi:hypothetical protein
LFICTLDLISMENEPAFCSFTSRLGSRWTVHLRMPGLTEEVISVIRPYKIGTETTS